ncbi:D-alanyl-D-alanine carboxypeptidase/D-alanyl-D-alanine endopeptidase [Desulforhabdus amnigena]|uniref:Peptidase n=1 Tax=Desulforhabdus amnigena TaxID=40218 RepID=A0A9W6FV22_9BACT|nr:D-alanyl-D-alanine carboxypeptidase/D-alanyl-D-alanine-endopeptidase [Desulforhabdus amnigena]NLJ28158.1 D-alanyl-D-alanine carboxypeptidase/D-alanyl-D-alanine-endopeptidase [Deltaproteobacteria bacterium]GLI35450.1 peptidase [Desulforhabdus amnigena]
MKRFRFLYSVPILVFLFHFSATVFASQASDGFYGSFIDRFQKTSGQFGLQVIALPSGHEVWEHKSRNTLVPASLVKVLTSYAALKTLGPFHHFNTEIWAMAAPQQGTLAGDIWIRSDGDNYLLSEKAWTLAQKVKEQGIQTIRGRIIVDNSFFFPPSEHICVDEKCDRSYNPVVSATAMEFNTVTLNITPGEKAGAPVEVSQFPPGDYIEVQNMATTGSSGSKLQLQLKSRGLTRDGHEIYQLSGNLPIGSEGGRQYRVNVDDPAAFFAHSFSMLLKQAGIDVLGKIPGTGTVPPGAKKIASYESAPLGDMLFGLNRYSNNFMAEMLLRSLGAGVVGTPGSVNKGVSVIRNTLEQLGVPGNEILLDSGSGLSRNCHVSPRAFCSVLTSAYRDFSITPEFISSLAMNSNEGTLRRRLRHSGVTVRGKTGTLKDVVGFSGYVSGPQGDLYAVTVILNDVKNLWEAREVLDSFLEELPSAASSSAPG